jgi:hypothetical protein
MRVSINHMINSLLLTMLSDSALTLLGPLNSTVPGCRDREAERVKDGIAVER